MDPDQDLLDRLEVRETRDIRAVAAVIATVSVASGLIGYFTLQYELHSGRESSLDGAVLIILAVAAGLFVAHRKIS
jgi:hypothetical protein